MRTSAEQRRHAEQQIRAAADALLRGDLPPGGKCDITTLARQAGISRAALYRTYPHVKEEFERRLAGLHAGRTTPDPRDARIIQLKTHTDELRQRLADRDAALRDLEQFKALAISRLAAQHAEITRLRRQAASADAANVLNLPPRRPRPVTAQAADSSK